LGRILLISFPFWFIAWGFYASDWRLLVAGLLLLVLSPPRYDLAIIIKEWLRRE
jgi:hypothetical protein